MNELAVINRNGQFVVDSREVAEMVDKRHADLLESINRYVVHLLNGNFRPVEFFIKSSYEDSTGRTLPCYFLTRKGCDMVANKMTGEKGVLFTAAYVTKFEEMEKRQFPAIVDSKMLYQIAQALEEKEKQIALMKPKAEFFDAVANSKDAIDLGTAAKVLNMGMGRTTLFRILREKKILNRENVPYQEYIDRGYFRTIEQKYTKPDGSTCINIKSLVYQKGLSYIRKILAEKKAI